ncbi:hypothetical protein BGX27_010532 [Mortierella sp. AM989]|nr:hypothetical protein BGX27_010532 [Mortierella sp. AM989]
MTELLEEIESLRGRKGTVTPNIAVRPNRSEYFPWTTDVETTSVKELTRSVYIKYPEREDGDVILAIIHPRGAPQCEGGGTERLRDDQHLRNIIKQYLKANMKKLVVSLEVPTKKFTDFTLEEAVLIFEGALTLAPERALRGRHGHGKVDYSIEASVGGMAHILGVAEVKKENFKKGVAQNLVQLESPLSIRKRKLEDDDDGVDGDLSIPMKSYGIVTDAAH